MSKEIENANDFLKRVKATDNKRNKEKINAEWERKLVASYQKNKDNNLKDGYIVIIEDYVDTSIDLSGCIHIYFKCKDVFEKKEWVVIVQSLKDKKWVDTISLNGSCVFGKKRIIIRPNK